MAWIDDLTDLMADTVVVSSLASVSTDGYGTAVYSTGTSYTARLVRRQQLVRTFEGTEELSQAHAWIASTSTFSPSAKFTVGGSTLGPLMALEAFPDENGVAVVKAYWG